MGKRSRRRPASPAPNNVNTRPCTPEELAKFREHDGALEALTRELGAAVARARAEEARLVAAVLQAQDVRAGYVKQLAMSKGISEAEWPSWRLLPDLGAYVLVTDVEAALAGQGGK